MAAKFTGGPPARSAAVQDELIRLYPALVAFFGHRLPDHRRDEARDLAHDTLLAAWSALAGSAGAVQDLVPYVLGIARNKYNAVLREVYRRPRVSLDEAPEGDFEAALGPAARDFGLAEVELRETLLKALEGLEDVERELLKLRYYHGYANREACLRLGIPPEQGSRLKYRALAKLRGILASSMAGRNGCAGAPSE